MQDSSPAAAGASVDRRLSELEIENRHLRARLDTLALLAPVEIVDNFESVNSESISNRPVEEFTFDDRRDIVLAHFHREFENVLHVFNEEYFGIRAAAGYLPGKKLSITALRAVSARSISRIIDEISKERIKSIVLHGYSSNMDRIARAIVSASGLKLHCVWHGNFGQLVYRDERAAFQSWLKLQEDGLVARAHILKQNSSAILKCGYVPMLLNLPPRWVGSRIAAPFEVPEQTTAFLPSWSDIRKNWHTNFLAAADVKAIRKIVHYADVRPLVRVDKPHQRLVFAVDTHLDVVSTVDIIFNATLIDCHPMVDLEALACGTPALTSRLFLGELDRHPYAKLTNVENPLDMIEIRDCANKVGAVSPSEITAVMEDYSKELIRESISRYGEFLSA